MDKESVIGKVNTQFVGDHPRWRRIEHEKAQVESLIFINPARDPPLFLLASSGVLLYLFIQVTLTLTAILLLFPFNAEGLYNILPVEFKLNIRKQGSQPYRKIC